MTAHEWAAYLSSQISMLLGELEMAKAQIQAMAEENAQLRSEVLPPMHE